VRTWPEKRGVPRLQLVRALTAEQRPDRIRQRDSKWQKNFLCTRRIPSESAGGAITIALQSPCAAAMERVARSILSNCWVMTGSCTVTGGSKLLTHLVTQPRHPILFAAIANETLSDQQITGALECPSPV